MMVLSVDVTPWVVATATLGALFGAWIRRPLYNVFGVLATFFSLYATTPLLGMQYNVFVAVSWLLAVFFGTSSVANLVSAWVRRIEMMLQMLQTQLEALKLIVEEK